MEDNLVDIINNEIKKQLNKSYDEFKEQKLKDLDIELELQRNKILSDILNSITMVMDTDLYSDKYNINIRIEKKIIIKED